MFRADQLFEPNADGADMIIPEIAFRVAIPDSLSAGSYPIRVLGASAAEGPNRDRRVVEAQTTLIMGPLLDLWNFIRRPLPEIEVTVVEPWKVRLSADQAKLAISRGGHATLEVQAEHLPSDADIQVKGLPSGVDSRVSRQDDRFTVTLAANSEVSPGLFDISAETRVGGRWVATGAVALEVKGHP